MYYSDETVLFFDGNFLKASEARGNMFDQSLHYGYAVFEGIRAYDTNNGVRIFKALEHFERMQYSCRAVGIPYPFENSALIDTCYEVLERNDLRDAYLRPLVTATPNMQLTKAKGSQLMIAAWPWGAYLGEQLLNISISSYRRISPSSFQVEAKVSGHYVNSILATQEAKDKGFDEALLLDMNGYVAEGPGANIFIEKDGTLYTPEKGSILPGITRKTVMELCAEFGIPNVEKKIRPEELLDADAAFFCGTAAEVIGIASVDHIKMKKHWNDSLGSLLQRAYKNLVLEENFTNAASVA